MQRLAAPHGGAQLWMFDRALMISEPRLAPRVLEQKDSAAGRRRVQIMNDHEIRARLRGTDAERVLVAAHEAGEGEVSLEFQEAATGDASLARQAARELQELHLADEERTLEGELTFTTLGIRVGSQIARSRLNGVDRWDAVQRAVLQYVAVSEPSTASSMVGTEAGVVDGRSATEDEVAMAVDYLVQHDLLKVIGIAEIRDLRPSITVNGRYAIEEPSIRDFVDRGFRGVTNNDYSTKTHISGGNVGAVTSGQGNTTTVHQRITTEQQSRIVQITQQILDQLPAGGDEETALLRAEVVALQGEANSDAADRESLACRAGKAALLAASTEAGRRVLELVGQLGDSLLG